MTSKFGHEHGSAQWALRELGLAGNEEHRCDVEHSTASATGPSPGRVVDRSTLALPKLHPDIARQDRIRVFEMVLRGHVLEAFSLAAELEQQRLNHLQAKLRRWEHERRLAAAQRPARAVPDLTAWPTEQHPGSLS